MIAFSGTALLSFEGSAGGSPLNAGDAWSLAAAAASAAFILRLEGRAQDHNATELSATTLACCAGLCLGWAAVDTITSGLVRPDVEDSSKAIDVAAPPTIYPAIRMLYLSIISAATTWLQTVGQRSIRAQVERPACDGTAYKLTHEKWLTTLHPLLLFLYPFAFPFLCHTTPVLNTGCLALS